MNHGLLTDPRVNDDPANLPAIEAELARQDVRFRFLDRGLEAAYQVERQLQSRLHNRIMIPILIGIFDVFLLAEVEASPEILGLSALLRFGVLTPAAALFVLMDWRGRIARGSGAAIVLLAIAPTLIAGIETLRITSPGALPNTQAVPLLLLAVLTWRISVRQACVINGVCCLIYFYTVLHASFVPPGYLVTMLLTEASLAMAMLAFALRMDFRDRQVFLLGRQANIGRAILAEQNQALSRLTQVDSLTGLGNRRCFDETMAAIWGDAAQLGASVTLVMFDIDHFKQFNDAFGHQAGDECLCALARVVTQCLRSACDRVVRYGGEEFAIILPATSLEEGREVAERVRLAMLARAVPHPCVGPPGCVTISLGVATMMPGLDSIGSLIETADRCLYAAKRNGRNQVATEDPPCVIQAGGLPLQAALARFPPIVLAGSPPAAFTRSSPAAFSRSPPVTFTRFPPVTFTRFPRDGA